MNAARRLALAAMGFWLGTGAGCSPALENPARGFDAEGIAETVLRLENEMNEAVDDMCHR